MNEKFKDALNFEGIRNLDDDLTSISFCIIKDRKIAKDLRNEVLALVHVAREQLKMVEKQMTNANAKLDAIERTGWFSQAAMEQTARSARAH